MRWTDDPIELSDWFEAHPETAALHWWDAHVGVFRSLRRDTLSSAPIQTLRRTMIVWQEPSGESPPIHTFDTAQIGPLIELRQGLNLLRWYGSDDDAVTIRDAIRWIAPNVVSVTRMDGETHVCHLDPVNLFELPWGLSTELGEADLLAIEVRQDVSWTQSWQWYPIYASFGDVAPAASAELREQIREVSGFVAARYGLAAHPYAVLLLTETGAMSSAFRALTGSEYDMSWWPEDACGVGWADGVGLLVGCRDPIAFDHEYLHVIQMQLARGGQGSSWLTEPAWLLEGAAEYFAARYRDAMRYKPYHEARREAVNIVKRAFPELSLDKLEHIEGFRAADPEVTYALGMLAAEWLAAHTGDSALFEFQRQLSRAGKRWHFAFDITFGMTVSEFYDAFRQHSATFGDPRPFVLRGVVLGPDDQAVPGLEVIVFPADGGYGTTAQTDEQGKFAISVSSGTFRVALHSESGCTSYGQYGDGGNLVSWISARTVIVGKQHEPDLVLRLPEPIEDLRGWSTCDEAEGSDPIRGRVLDPQGDGVSGVNVLACGPSSCARSLTDQTGAYSIDTPEETVRLFAGPDESGCQIWGVRGADGVLFPSDSEGSFVELTPRMAPVDIRFPAPTEELELFDHCW